MVAIYSKDSLYVNNLLPKSDDFYRELEIFAEKNNVPIIDKISIEYLKQLLIIKKASNVLEIGTAIGYSSMQIAEYVGCDVTTIERDKKMYSIACDNVLKRELNNKINIIFNDALNLTDDVIKKAPYDVVFIDGAKSQSKKFFEIYEPYFSDDVLIITDNVLFKGMVSDPSLIKHSKDLRQLSKKISNYNEWLMKNDKYKTVILPFGDGLSITIRNN